MRPVSGGMSLAAAAKGKRTKTTARTPRKTLTPRPPLPPPRHPPHRERGRTDAETRGIISVLLPPQLVAQLVAIVGPELYVVPRQHLAALSNSLYQGGPRPAVPDLRGQSPGDALPLSLLDLLMNARVGQQHHTPLEEGDEEEDARPLLGVKTLLLEEGRGGPAVHSCLQHVLAGQPAADRRKEGRDEVGCGAADRPRQCDPIRQGNSPDVGPAVDREGDQRP